MLVLFTFHFSQFSCACTSARDFYRCSCWWNLWFATLLQLLGTFVHVSLHTCSVHDSFLTLCLFPAHLLRPGLLQVHLLIMTFVCNAFEHLFIYTGAMWAFDTCSCLTPQLFTSHSSPSSCARAWARACARVQVQMLLMQTLLIDALEHLGAVVALDVLYRRVDLGARKWESNN